jgi:hypothetical protein
MRNNELSDPYLIQRLKKPFKIQNKEGKEGIMESLANAFSFGGGLINGGLSKDAMSIINDIWRYDYMGSSEFEWGAVPKSLHQMGEYAIKGNLTSFEFEVTAEVSDFSYDFAKKRNKSVKKKANAIVYVICNKDFTEQIKGFITNMASSNKGYRLKESLNFKESICGFEYHTDVVGWHDIDNHYLFFTDKEMFYKISVIFGLNEPVTESKDNG